MAKNLFNWQKVSPQFLEKGTMDVREVIIFESKGEFEHDSANIISIKLSLP